VWLKIGGFCKKYKAKNRGFCKKYKAKNRGFCKKYKAKDLAPKRARS